MTSTQKVSASQHENYLLFTVISLLIPIAGIIMGIIFLTKDGKLNKKIGEHLVAVSIFFMIMWGIFLSIFWGSIFTTTTTTTTIPSQSLVETANTTAWDPTEQFSQINNNQTKTEVEAFIGKQPTDCTTTETPDFGTTEICSYGDYLNDLGILTITYMNGKVYDKTKTIF